MKVVIPLINAEETGAIPLFLFTQLYSCYVDLGSGTE